MGAKLFPREKQTTKKKKKRKKKTELRDKSDQ